MPSVGIIPSICDLYAVYTTPHGSAAIFSLMNDAPQMKSRKKTNRYICYGRKTNGELFETCYPMSKEECEKTVLRNLSYSD